MLNVRVLTVVDLHQSRLHYRSLVLGVEEQHPDVVAIVGDALEAFSSPGKYRFTADECAGILAGLPVTHLVFTRGNHEDSNWTNFVYAWPHDQRPLIGLYGSYLGAGPLGIIGFPCMTGDESTWCEHLPLRTEPMEIYTPEHRKPLPSDTNMWLPLLIRSFPASRCLWLMHEPPIGLPLAREGVWCPAWTEAVARWSPCVTVSGHDHDSPIDNKMWHTKLGETVCINVGQSENELHYAVLDFEFESEAVPLPAKITIKAFPWDQQLIVDRPNGMS
jgi:hypothetical protein